MKIGGGRRPPPQCPESPQEGRYIGRQLVWRKLVAFKTRTSTRRFCARPSRDLLSATGLSLPNPTIETRNSGMFLLTRYRSTASARRWLSPMLYCSSPVLSVYPCTSIMYPNRWPPTLPAIWSRALFACSDNAAEFNANRSEEHTSELPV